MLDASSKIPSGILAGNLEDLGNFDECLAIKEKVNDNIGVIYGKYCQLSIPLQLLTRNLELGIREESEMEVGFLLILINF